MLLDILGILIAYVSVILIFSIIVTSVVEIVQQFLQLRNANLIVGFDVIRRQLHINDNSWSELKKAFLDDPLPEQKYSFTKPVTANFTELASYIETNSNYDTQQLTSFKRIFPKIEAAMTQRYKSIMLMMSMAVSLFVTLAFQLSSFDILKNVSSNEKLRNELIAFAEDQRKPINNWGFDVNYKTIAKTALSQIKNSHPTLDANAITQVIDASGSKHRLLAQLKTVFKDNTKLYQHFVYAYDSVLAQTINSNIEAAGKQKQAASSVASTFSFQLLPGGWEYYYSVKNGSLTWLNHWLGMIFTAILLTLGAPYWFEILRKLLIIRRTFLTKS